MRRVLFSPFAAFVAALCVGLFLVWWTPPRSPSPDSHQELQEQLAYDLHRVRLIDDRVRVLGYSRQQFGQGWGHTLKDGVVCTSRQHEIREVFGGTGCAQSTENTEAADPYTGMTMRVEAVDVDHLVPLAAAWDLGAWSWDRQTRITFANDMDRNLIVTSSAANRDKSDATLSEWMPAMHRCAYAVAFIHVVAEYRLALPRADMEAAQDACG